MGSQTQLLKPKSHPDYQLGQIRNILPSELETIIQHPNVQQPQYSILQQQEQALKPLQDLVFSSFIYSLPF